MLPMLQFKKYQSFLILFLSLCLATSLRRRLQIGNNLWCYSFFQIFTAIHQGCKGSRSASTYVWISLSVYVTTPNALHFEISMFWDLLAQSPELFRSIASAICLSLFLPPNIKKHSSFLQTMTRKWGGCIVLSFLSV